MTDKYIKSAMKLATELALEAMGNPSVAMRRGARMREGLYWYNTEFFAFAVPASIHIECDAFDKKGVRLDGFEPGRDVLVKTDTTVKAGKRTLRILYANSGRDVYADEKYLKLFWCIPGVVLTGGYRRGNPAAIAVWDADGTLIGVVMPTQYKEGGKG